MASDGSTAAISASAVFHSQTSDPSKFLPAAGKQLPQGGNATAVTVAAASTSRASASPESSKNPTAATSAKSQEVAAASNAKSNQAKSTTASKADPQTLVNQINKSLNDSGRADEFRLSPDSDKYIQQVNPSNGEVIAQYAVSEFPALARSIGVSGLLIDDVA